MLRSKSGLVNIIIACIIITFLLLWPFDAGAQVGSSPTPTNTPVVAPAVPVATLTPFEPTPVILSLRHVWLPVVRK